MSTLPDHKLAKLPTLSPTMETGTIASWTKNEGDKLEEGDLLCQVETDKAVVSMETPFTGYLAKILFPEHSKDVPINQPIAIIVKSKDDVAAFKDYVYSGSISKPVEPVASEPVQPTQAPTSPTSVATSQTIKASPLAKKIAREAGIALNTVKGTGPGGRILGFDVREVIASGGSKSTVSPSSKDETAFKDAEVSTLRKTIAKRLQESKRTIPHFSIDTGIYMDECLKLRESVNKTLAGKHKISINDFIIKAASLALLDVPACNSQWMETFIREFTKADISVAVSTDTGLITPIIFDASNKTILTISKEMNDLALRARSNKLALREFQGGTFTISNIGMYGIRSVTPIINPPQSCILGVGSTKKEMVFLDKSDTPTVKSVMNVTLCCDHRVVDGAVAAQWLKRFKEYIECPYLLFF